LGLSVHPCRQAWWSVVDWPGVEKRYIEAIKETA